MKKVMWSNDLRVLYVTAHSFPEGIQKAIDELYRKVPLSGKRTLMGISRAENNGSITYRAAFKEIENGEAQKLNLDSAVLKKGEYIYEEISNFRNNMSKIGQTFEELLKHPTIDPEGYCIEVYDAEKESVRCLVRIAT